MTTNQQTPIKNEGKSVNIGLGSTYARQLGLGDMSEYDGTSGGPNQSGASDNTNKSLPAENSEKKKKKKKKKK